MKKREYHSIWYSRIIDQQVLSFCCCLLDSCFTSWACRLLSSCCFTSGWLFSRCFRRKCLSNRLTQIRRRLYYKDSTCFYCCHFIFLISCMHIVCFWFCQLHSIVGSVGHHLWEKEHHDAIHSARNLEMACCTAWHSHRKLQCEHFRVFGCQSEDSAEDLERVGFA